MYYLGVMLLRRQSKLSIPLIRYLLPAHGPHCTAPVAEDCVARKCDRFKRIEYCDALSCILRHASLPQVIKYFVSFFVSAPFDMSTTGNASNPVCKLARRRIHRRKSNITKRMGRLWLASLSQCYIFSRNRNYASFGLHLGR